MRFCLGDLQVVGLIVADLPWIGNEGFFTANVRFTGQGLSFMTSGMDDAAMDLAGDAEIVKELWSEFYSQF